MNTILSTIIQLIDNFYGLPTGVDVIASCIEDWWESYKDIQRMKIS